MNNDKDKIRQQIYLGALLHDIGKFYQRYDANSASKSELLDDAIKKLESVYCPNYNNYFTHKHVLWTAQFFDNHREKINKIFGLSKDDDTLMTLAASHHSPDPRNKWALIIQQADILSSAAEREEKKQDFKDDEQGWDGFKKIPLKSIFDLISLDGNYPDCAINPIETKPLTINKLPVLNNSEYNPDYGIWEAFNEEFCKIPDTLSPDNFIVTLDALLHRFTYCIPSSTVDEPDISLYDHLKTTAFLSVALFDYYSENENLTIPLADTCKPFVLLGGDISGIQDFIYDIPSEGAAKQLKARSFYLHIITETIVRNILKDFNLLQINVVYSSGGNFYILVPNLKDLDDKIQNLNRRINEQLRRVHGTDIYLAMGYNEISIKNLKQKECSNSLNSEKCLSQIWDDLISEKIFKVKNQRYLSSIKEKYDEYFEPTSNFGKQSQDEKFLSKLELLGKNLRGTQFIVYSSYKHPNIKEEYCFDTKMGFYIYLLNENPAEKFEKSEIIKLNDTNIVNDIKNDNTYRFEFYGGNKYPVGENGYPKTFDKLAEGKNLDRLGIVRMDVDNLGKIFAEGFNPRLRTFSRLTALSRSLDLFFKGYINTIWDRDEFKNDTYILYSGGDDLFIVGRWDKTIEFAYEVKKAFFEFTKSTEFGLSGGVSIEKSKFPIRRAAYNAGKFEGMAKEFRIKSENIDKNYSKPYQKNAFTLFNTALSWQSDFEKVLTMKNDIKKHLFEKQNVSHSFFNSIKLFYMMQQEQTKKELPESWRWTAAYYLQRAKERLGKNNQSFINYIDDLKISMFTDRYRVNQHNEPLNSNYSFLQLLAIAVRWAELELRTEGK